MSIAAALYFAGKLKKIEREREKENLEMFVLTLRSKKSFTSNGTNKIPSSLPHY